MAKIFSKILNHMKNKYCFVYNNKELAVPGDNLDFLNKIGINITQDLISKGKYYILSKVKPENFQSFYAFLTSSDGSIEIKKENYYDYHHLSEEFNNILSDILSKQEYEELRNDSILQNLITEEKKDKSKEEKYVANNLDYFLEHFSEQMSQVPFTSLFNIFNHEDRNLKDQDKAYQFIITNIDKNDELSKKSFCILLGCLEGNKLSQKSIKESLNKRDDHFGFAPKTDDSFISSVNKNINELKSQIAIMMQQQQQIFEKITQNFDQKLNSIENKYAILSNKIDETQKIVCGINNNVHQISQKIENEPNTEKINDIQSDIRKISQQMGNNNVSDDLQQLKMKINSINDNCNKSSKQIEDIDHRTQLHFMLDHDPFNGIIRQLTKECNGNVHQNGIVNVTSSSCSASRYPHYAIDFDDNLHYFCSDDAPNQWLQYDFKNRKVRPTHYSIKTCHEYGKGQYGMMNWIVQGSNDGVKWIELDYRKGVTDLDNFYAFHTFEIQKTTDFYRYLRITQNGPNSGGSHYLIFSALEYFGSIK